MGIEKFLRDVSLRFRGRGIISDTVAAGVSTDLDYILTEDSWINASQLILQGHAWGDSVDFQVVHPVAGVVNQFGFNWYVDPSKQDQGVIEVPEIPAKIPQGMIIRIKYNSTGVDPVKVLANVWIHTK